MSDGGGFPALDPDDAEMVADELRALGWSVTAPGEFVGVRAASQMLGVHENTIRNWATSGALPDATLPSGSLRFRRSVVEAFAAAREARGPHKLRDPLRVEVRAILAEWTTESGRGFSTHVGLMQAFADTIARLANALGEPLPPPNLPPVPPATDPSWLVERDDGDGFEMLGGGRDE